MLSLSLLATLFAAGALTILLPCILPLIPIVLGVSIAGKNKLRPLVTIIGMLITFVFFTFILQVLLSQFVSLADYIRISTYYILLLFGVCFLTSNKNIQLIGVVLVGFFYTKFGWIAVTIAECVGWAAVEVGGRVAAKIQQLGSDVQQSARSSLGAESLVTAFIVGLTLGLVWVPCAGPALSFALTLVRDQPGPQALLALFAYGLGASFPLLIVGYGGQAAVHSVRALTKYSGRIKQVAGALLILSALAFQYNYFDAIQTYLVNNTSFGTLGTDIEEKLFPTQMPSSIPPATSSGSTASVSSAGKNASAGSSISAAVEGRSESTMVLPILPKITRAPELTGTGKWFNSDPLTLASLKGKVVLIDFWTYSCINCIRTLPYIEGYWNKYKGMPFVIIGVHTPEFVFEHDADNVAQAIKRHGLTYPIVQDNEFDTWKAFANQYWPAKYLIDANGYIRYTHFGEGEYDQTDLAIQSLLKEATGKTAAGPVIGADEQSTAAGGPVSPETYIGERNWPSFVNALGDPDGAVHTYTMPVSVPVNKYALSGDWQVAGGEYQVLRTAEGEIRYHAQAGEVNLVLGLEDGIASVQADVYVDGKKTQTITIKAHDLYNLYKGSYGDHDVDLKIHGKGVQAYAYTFGA